MLVVLCLVWLVPISVAQTSDTSEDLNPIIQTPPAVSDASIKSRISAIFDEIESLNRVTVEVNHGVVRLAGEVPSSSAVARAEDLALRVNGVVTVENEIDRSLSVQDSATPFFGDPSGTWGSVVRALPLYGIALGVFLTIALIGHLVASWRSFWRWILPNPFLVELVSGAFRIVLLLVALVV
ncbi:MAG: BON domain-containing protein, partial [Hyphomonas sp.]